MKPQQQLLLMRVSSVKSRDCEAVPTTSSTTNAPIPNKSHRKDQIMQRTTSSNATNNGNSEDKSIQQQSK